MSATPSPIITRFAPSPTGHLHIGGARTALFCWAFAKRAEMEHVARGGRAGEGGRFMIRIEDTDQARSSEESARGILEDLAWLGIEWDDGPLFRVPRLCEPGAKTHPEKTPGSESRATHTIGAHSRDVGSYFQAQRAAAGIYNAYIESLVKSGHAYPAFESNEEIDALRKEYVARKQTFKYPRPADVQLGVFNEQRWKRALAGERHVIRFAMDADAVVVHDQVLGDVKIAPGEVDDFVIRKADNFPTYHFAVVIDDELMGVTHILRAQEHLANTPRHVAMQRALKRIEPGFEGQPFRPPLYAHMPLIFNMDGTKMSKRDKAKVARAAAKRFVAAFSEDEFFRRFEQTALEGHGIEASVILSPSEAKANFGEFIQGKSDSPFWAAVISRMLDIPLPEIEVFDFRAAGYLPEAITNFLSLLGWNPGMKQPDGKDLEKFDNTFLAQHFALDRIGKTNAKFDRNKLLSFNADAIGKLTDADFASRWRAFLAEYEPDALAKLDARGPQAALILATIIKPRAKTLRDALTAARFALTSDTDYPFDPKSLAKLNGGPGASPGTGPSAATISPAPSGRELLAAARTALAAIPDSTWSPPTLHTTLEHLAAQLHLGTDNAAVGKLAQPLRIAVTGTGVSPGIAETLAILGKPSTLARIDRCLAIISS
jgi:glutamyl-tRNA synthetase